MKLALVNVFKDSGAPPMGLVYIATYLKEYANFEDTKIIDTNVHDVWYELKRYQPDLIGISAMSNQIQREDLKFWRKLLKTGV